MVLHRGRLRLPGDWRPDCVVLSGVPGLACSMLWSPPSDFLGGDLLTHLRHRQMLELVGALGFSPLPVPVVNSVPARFRRGSVSLLRSAESSPFFGGTFFCGFPYVCPLRVLLSHGCGLDFCHSYVVASRICKRPRGGSISPWPCATF